MYSLIRPSGTFSREEAREKAEYICPLPLLPTGEGARRAGEGKHVTLSPRRSTNHRLFKRNNLD
jgi:hypothetical protein